MDGRFLGQTKPAFMAGRRPMSLIGTLPPRLAGEKASDRIAEMAGRQSSPCTGKSSARPAGKPGDFFVKGGFATIPSTPPDSAAAMNTGRPVCVFKAWRNLSGPMWSSKTKPTLGRDRATSRRSAPIPGTRTRREAHALAHRPQMSSGRLFLDRVARQHCPSPLHRRFQNKLWPSREPGLIIERQGVS